MPRIRLLLGLALALAALAQAPAKARDAPIPAIEATGSAREIREPDRAILALRVEAFAPSAEQATRDLSAKATRVTGLLSASGISDADTESDGPLVEPAYEIVRNERGQEIVEKRRRTGFKAVLGLSVTILKIDALPALLPRAADAGALLRSVDYTLSDRAERMAALEERSVKSALERARRLIAAAGARPGRILSITPQDAAPMPRAPAPFAMARAAVAEAEEPTIPVRPGRITLDARVSVAIEIVTPADEPQKEPR